MSMLTRTECPIGSAARADQAVPGGSGTGPAGHVERITQARPPSRDQPRATCGDFAIPLIHESNAETFVAAWNTFLATTDNGYAVSPDRRAVARPKLARPTRSEDRDIAVRAF